MLNLTYLIVWLRYLGHLNNKNQAHGVIETKYCVARKSAFKPNGPSDLNLILETVNYEIKVSC